MATQLAKEMIAVPAEGAEKALLAGPMNGPKAFLILSAAKRAAEYLELVSQKSVDSDSFLAVDKARAEKGHVDARDIRNSETTRQKQGKLVKMIDRSLEVAAAVARIETTHETTASKK